MDRINSKGQNGQILVLTAFSLVALIAVTGLAVDSGMGYIVKAKLNSAVDAAGIAAARVLPQGEAEASRAAEKYFSANYPSGWMGSNPMLTGVNFSREAETGRTFIDISATATKPVSLMSVLGFNLMTVQASAQVVRKDVDVVLVLDTTASIDTSDRPVLLLRAKQFLSKFNQISDRVGLLHFASGTEVDVGILQTVQPSGPSGRGFNLNTMETAINALTFGGNTNFSEALWTARKQLDDIPEQNRSPLRVIVFFSDGSPNSFASTFTFQRNRICTWPAGWPTLAAGTPPCPSGGAACTRAAGTVMTGDSTSTTTPNGLNRYDRRFTEIDPAGTDECNPAFFTTPSYRSNLIEIPPYYNPHQITETEFPLRRSASITNGWREVTADVSNRTIAWRNINNTARNLSWDMAQKITTKRYDGGTYAVRQNTYIFTLGLSDLLHENTGPNHEMGEHLLKAMANTKDAVNPLAPNQLIHSDDRNTGIYCWARNASDLGPCFDKMASEITRLSR